MGYCVDDLCHDGTPECGATSPYHCTATSFGNVVCSDPTCEICQPDDEHGEAFVLDLAENPHPKMLAGARRARSMAGNSPGDQGFWQGYLTAMADATGCEPADLEAWMDRQ